MKKLSILVFLLLTGCMRPAIPITVKFPDAPAPLTVDCEKLKEAAEDSTFTEFTHVITENYAKYHECAAKVNGWNDWYVQQKKIFEDATKH